jgi:phosphate transport system ATP-binding protein
MESLVSSARQTETVLRVENVDIYYGDFRAVRDASLDILKNRITAFIGPSGCGKSTILRCFNRLNDLIDSFHLKGTISYHGQNLYDSEIDPVEVRKRIGMVFQKPNPFPKSIYDNVAYGARVNNYKGDLDELVETSLRRAALWDEVKDKLKESGFSLSGGQQQRLCIARAIAAQPEVVLMDEPCSALDPISTLKIEELMHELKERYTIVIVTHNMQQATRVADMTAFFNAEATEKGNKVGYLVEYDRTEAIFGNPSQQATRDYVSGRFG